jgi:hypothetical protein
VRRLGVRSAGELAGVGHGDSGRHMVHARRERSRHVLVIPQEGEREGTGNR